MTDTKEPGVASVNRALAIMLAFKQSKDGLTLAEICEITGLYHSTVLRICESLMAYDFVKRLSDGRFMVGPIFFNLGAVYQESFNIRDYARPVLKDLVKNTQEVAAIYVREGDHRICLQRLEHHRSVRTHVREGDVFSLDQGAAGKIFRSVEHAASTGGRPSSFAVSKGERDAESAAIACPVFDSKQNLICVISLGIPLYRFNDELLQKYLPFVKQAAAQLTRDFGGDVSGFID